MTETAYRIAKVTAIPLEIPFSPFGTDGQEASGWAGNAWKALSILLVRVETTDGLVGWGEAFSYNCLRPVAAAVEDMIAPLAVGRDARDVQAINQDAQRALHLWGRYGITLFALSGLDIALWDILGKAAGQSLATLLGGRTRDRVDGYASLFRYGDTEIVAERTRAALDDGYRILKLHEFDPDCLRVARETTGDAVPITVDVNCTWTPRQARDAMRAMAPYDPYWIEEPVFPPEDYRVLAALQRDTGLAVAAGENACTAVEFGAMFDADAVRFAQPSVTKIGGISEFVKAVTLADRNGVAVMPHSPYFGPGFAATVQLLGSVVPDGWLERFYLSVEADLYGGLADCDADGRFAVPDGPGLGIDPDADVIKEYRVKTRN